MIMHLETGAGPSVEVVAALRCFESEDEANAVALSLASTLVARGTWANGKHLSKSIDIGIFRFTTKR